MENNIIKTDLFFQNKKLEYSYDNLTNLLNREIVFEYAQSLVDRKIPFSMLICDVDNFKNVNDCFGHVTGDVVLAKVAKSIDELASKFGVVGRYGGDEFIIIIPNVIEYDDIWHISKDITSSVNNLVFKELRGENVSITLGISRYTIDGNDLNTLFGKMDKALYRGKQKGRNCFIIYLDAKHANIELKTSKDIMFTSMDMHARVANILTYSDDLKDNIIGIVKYLCVNLMIDHIGIQSLNRLCCYSVYELATVKESKYIDSNMINEHINRFGLFRTNNIKMLSDQGDKAFHDVLEENKIVSFAASKIEGYGNNYGMLRADSTNADGRIWQTSDLDLFVMTSRVIGILLAKSNCTLDDLFDETILITSLS